MPSKWRIVNNQKQNQSENSSQQTFRNNSNREGFSGYGGQTSNRNNRPNDKDNAKNDKSRDTQNEESGSPTKRSVTCYKCREVGHYRSNCPLNNESTDGQNQDNSRNTTVPKTVGSTEGTDRLNK